MPRDSVTVSGQFRSNAMAGTFATSHNPSTVTTGTLVPVSKGRGSIPIPPDNQSSYSAKDLVELAYAAGFPNAALAAAISMAEDGTGDPTVTHLNSNGSTDTGLWQINSVHGYSEEQLKNPYYNVAAAKQVFDSQGWGAWTTYNTGAAIQNYYVTEPIATSMGIPLKDSGTIGTGASGVANVLGTVASPVTNAVGGAFGNIAGLIGNLTSGAFWMTVLKILGGLILVLMGAYLLLKGSSNTNITLSKLAGVAE